MICTLCGKQAIFELVVKIANEVSPTRKTDIGVCRQCHGAIVMIDWTIIPFKKLLDFSNRLVAGEPMPTTREEVEDKLIGLLEVAEARLKKIAMKLHSVNVPMHVRKGVLNDP